MFRVFEPAFSVRVAVVVPVLFQVNLAVIFAVS